MLEVGSLKKPQEAKNEHAQNAIFHNIILQGKWMMSAEIISPYTHPIVVRCSCDFCSASEDVEYPFNGPPCPEGWEVWEDKSKVKLSFGAPVRPTLHKCPNHF